MRDYFALDVRSLALFRWCLGAMTLVEALARISTHVAHYTDAGVLPRELLTRLSAHGVWSLHMLDGGPALQVALLGAMGLSGLTLAVGWWARSSAAVAYLLLVSAMHRNPLIEHAGYSYLALLLLWMAFVPSAAVWSVDAWRARRRGAGLPAARVVGLGTVALFLQPWLMYTMVAWSKLQYAPWHEGRAVYAMLHKTHYVRELGKWALTVPGFVPFATYATVVGEILIAVLWLSPVRRALARTAAVLLGMAFQLSLFVMVNIGLFQPIAAASALPILPRSFWDRFARARRAVAEGQDDPRPLDPIFARPGSRAAVSPRAWLGAAPVTVLLALSLIAAVTSMPRQRVDRPEWIETPLRIFFLGQRWRMFANIDTTRQGYWVPFGVTRDGRRVDLWRLRPEVSFDEPDNYSSEMPTDHWRIYWSTISNEHYAPFRPGLAHYFCRRWNGRFPDDPVEKVNVVWAKKVAVDPQQPIRRQMLSLVELPCPSGEGGARP
ncbi:MAG: HTTM domain-containing protein [Myxococcales bacterium]|jgi:hypothetical protein